MLNVYKLDGNEDKVFWKKDSEGGGTTRAGLSLRDVGLNKTASRDERLRRRMSTYVGSIPEQATAGSMSGVLYGRAVLRL